MRPKCKTVLVEVTADDIRHGLRTNCQGCPVAIALRRVVPGTWSVNGLWL